MSRRLRVAILGRTEMLLETARQLVASGHEVPLVATCKASDTSAASERDFEALASGIGADYFCTAAINAPAQLERLRRAGCDLAVSMNWLTLIGAQARDSFPLGVFNAHPGALPRFRGNACPNWAILTNEAFVGLCIHQMVDELDAGPIALRDQLPLNDDVDVEHVYGWLHRRVPQMFVELVQRAASGQLRLEPQSPDPADSLRCYPRKPEDSRIVWSQSAEEVLRMVRASTRPMQGAFCYLHDDRVIIWKAEVHRPAGPFLAIPGQVCLRFEGDPVVACGQGMVRLREISMEDMGHREASNAIGASLRNRLT